MRRLEDIFSLASYFNFLITASTVYIRIIITADGSEQENDVARDLTEKGKYNYVQNLDVL